MGLTINHENALSTLNNLFRNYAVDHDNNSSVAQLTMKDGQAVLVTNPNDHARGLFSKAPTGRNTVANDDTRAAFKEVVLKLFNADDPKQLPSGVRSAMKLGDYGKGRPLTARRIHAVIAAIDKYGDVHNNGRLNFDVKASSTPRPLSAKSNVVRQDEKLTLAPGFVLDMDDDRKKKRIFG